MKGTVKEGKLKFKVFSGNEKAEIREEGDKNWTRGENTCCENS